eukprot:scaffold8264_cov111-Skeletonema_dohrnii-CCMP3373.AAC.2
MKWCEAVYEIVRTRIVVFVEGDKKREITFQMKLFSPPTWGLTTEPKPDAHSASHNQQTTIQCIVRNDKGEC